MVLSKRERYIGIGAGVGLLLFLLNWVVVEPLMAERATLQTQIEAAQIKLTKAEGLITNKPLREREYLQMLGDGVTKDASDAESRIYAAVDQWSRQSGFNVTSTNRERGGQGEKEQGFFRMNVRVAGSGSMQQVSRFLWNVQTATAVPVRITDLTISPRKEATDDLAVNVVLATIYQSPDSMKVVSEGAVVPAPAARAASAPATSSATRETR